MSIQAGLELMQQGRLAEAGELFAAAVRAEPSSALALHLLGIVQLQTGAREEGLANLRRSVALDPTDPVVHANLANALRDSGAPVEALASYARAIALKPDFVEALCNRAMMLAGSGRLEEALGDCERAVILAPGQPMSHVGRGQVLLGMGRCAEAASSFEAALRLAPDVPELWRLHADALWRLGRIEDALASYDRVIALEPSDAAAWSGRGSSLRLLDRHEQALEALSRAIALQPAEAQHLFNRAVALNDLGRREEASADLAKAVELQPDFRLAKMSAAYAHLALGRFEQGWALYEARWQDTADYAFGGAPMWDGKTSLEGRTILLRGEQGLGDTLQFCRYAKLVKALGARVILEVQQPLVRLLKGLEGVDEVVAHSATPPPSHCHALLMSMPYVFGATLETIPAEIPYLFADPAETARWEARLGRRTRPRVGLVWSGGFHDEPALRWVNARRNIPLARLAPLKGSDVDFISLQKGEPGEGELKALKAQGWNGPDILEVMDEVSDFADTAALVEALDLVITVDTSTAHLAGALGKPVWIMNRYDSCWRWLTEREDSPWYPTVRLFRQERIGDWDAVVARVRAELDRFTAARAS